MIERIFRVYLPAVAIFCSSLLSIQPFRSSIKELLPVGLQRFPVSYILIQVALSSTILLYAFLSQGKKYKKFMLFEKNINKLVNERIAEIIESTEKDIRVNVALLRRTFLCTREPIFDKNYLRKPRLFRRIFVTVALSENMDHDSDKNPKFTPNQGICGLVYRKKHYICRDLRKPESRTKYKLNNRQLELTEDVKYVISFPIRELDTETSRPGERIIGVVNIDTLRSNVASQLAPKNSQLRSALLLKAKLLSLYCTKLYVR